MADRNVANTATLDTLRTTYNSTAADVGDITSVTGASGVIASATDIVEAITLMNTEVTGIKTGATTFESQITFEGATDDAHETTLAVTDPTADRTITFADASGTLVVTDATQTLTNKTLTAPTITSGVFDTGISGSAFLDEDGFDSNSATKLASQQSIKAYVDAQITAQDLDFQGDSGGALSIDLDSETLTIAGGTGIDTTGSGNSLTIAVDSTVTTLTGSQTLTNKTLTSPTITSGVLNTAISGSAFLDEDNMASNSATKLASQQSIKAYVDSAVAAEDLDIAADSGSNIDVALGTEVLTFAGGTGIATSVSGTTITVASDGTLVTKTGTLITSASAATNAFSVALAAALG